MWEQFSTPPPASTTCQLQLLGMTFESKKCQLAANKSTCEKELAGAKNELNLAYKSPDYHVVQS